MRTSNLPLNFKPMNSNGQSILKLPPAPSKKPAPPLVLKKSAPKSSAAVVSEPRVEMRNIYSLRCHPKQEYYFPSEAAADVECLMADILANGLREMIEVTPEDVIISGHRRRAALSRLQCDGHSQFEEVEVLVRYDLAAQGKQAIERRLLEANLNRRQLTVMEFARVTKAMHETEARTIPLSNAKLLNSIAGKFNVSRKTLERSWALLELPIELQRLVDNKRLTQQLAQQILDYATPAETEELRQLSIQGGNVKKRAQKLLQSRLPNQGRKPPSPTELLEQFLESSHGVAYYFGVIVQLIQENIGERPEMLKYLAGLRRAELIVPRLLDIVTHSAKLDPDDIAERPTLGKKSMAEIVTEMATALDAARYPKTTQPAQSPPAEKPLLILKRNPAV
ncbi:hypothetical protein ETAA8_45360 [Anatilimnocola aggregata]|uniref:ParB-like N-terminal domain-containing protein n=1 Tax=Anatilimnocola aggregata TaxID=2528021 RepID=A0A517YGR9_9BACT|nr:ParB N-terminal domain-containing protein [Anatilimnocola aggregata]QDU29426.1 hypothetical protein ETAA8_45360 [Anatilimnocola aggregata]